MGEEKEERRWWWCSGRSEGEEEVQERRKKKEKRRKKKEERADRNKSPSTIARTGTFCCSRAWNPHSDLQYVTSHSPTLPPIRSPSEDGLTIWQVSSSTSGGPHLLSPTFVVSMKVRNINPSLRSVSSSAYSRTKASWKSAVNLGFTTGRDSSLFSTSPILAASWWCIVMNETFAVLPPSLWTSLLEFHQNFHRTVAILMLIRQELECHDQVVTGSLRCSVRSDIFCLSTVRAILSHQDSVRIPPGHQMLHTTSCSASSHALNPPDEVLKRVSFFHSCSDGANNKRHRVQR